MNTRILSFTILGILIVGGLIAGLFASSIQKALTLPMPMVQAMMGTRNNQIAARATPAATATMPVQAASNVLTRDTFQRNNQLLWGTASDGSQWGGDANVKQAFSINGGSGKIANGVGTFEALLGPRPGAVDNTEVIVNEMVNQFVGGGNIGVVLRWNDTNNWYKALLDGTHLSILKRVKGVTTEIGNVPFQAQGGTSYMLRFRAVGSMLFTRVWKSGTAEPANWMITVDDTALTSGQTGIRVVLQGGMIVSITSFITMTVSSLV